MYRLESVECLTGIQRSGTPAPGKLLRNVQQHRPMENAAVAADRAGHRGKQRPWCRDLREQEGFACRLVNCPAITELCV